MNTPTPWPTVQPSTSAERAAVEPLVRDIYVRLYGPGRWESLGPHTQARITDHAIHCTRLGFPRALAHTDHHNHPHYIPASAINHALATVTKD